MSTCTDLHDALKSLVADLEDSGDDRNPETGKPYTSFAEAKKALDSYPDPVQTALIQQGDGGSGYILIPEWNSCWITVDQASVYLRRNQEGLEVEIYPLFRETDEPIASTWAMFKDFVQ